MHDHDQGGYRQSLTATMERLKSSLSVLMAEIPAGAPIVYLDQPVHLNVGDLLINMGVEALFEAHGRKVEHRFSEKDYDRFAHLIRDEHVIILHGGGNFGDIWPTHEALRQKVVKRFTRNKIILFPQTVHLKDPSKLDEYAAVYRAHPDFMMFLRDQRSHDIVAQQYRLRCAMAPDTAHQLWNTDMFKPDFAGEGELLVLRDDIEKSTDRGHGPSVDWHNMHPSFYGLVTKGFDRAMRANSSPALQAFLMRSWYAHRDRVTQCAVTEVRKYAHIRTDRLHTVIMSCLLGKRITMFDNNYGKLSTYFDAWMPGLIERADAGKAA